jgi:hypothetical protein
LLREAHFVDAACESLTLGAVNLYRGRRATMTSATTTSGAERAA